MFWKSLMAGQRLTAARMLLEAKGRTMVVRAGRRVRWRDTVSSLPMMPAVSVLVLVLVMLLMGSPWKSGSSDLSRTRNSVRQRNCEGCVSVNISSRLSRTAEISRSETLRSAGPSLSLLDDRPVISDCSKMSVLTYAIKNQRKARNAPSRGHFVPKPWLWVP